MMKANCPLCGAEAQKADPTGDADRYDCPECGEYKITGSEEAVIKANPSKAQEHRERIVRERERGITQHRVG